MKVCPYCYEEAGAHGYPDDPIDWCDTCDKCIEGSVIDVEVLEKERDGLTERIDRLQFLLNAHE
jgi:hypothetical protein